MSRIYDRRGSLTKGSEGAAALTGLGLARWVLEACGSSTGRPSAPPSTTVNGASSHVRAGPLDTKSGFTGHELTVGSTGVGFAKGALLLQQHGYTS